MIYFDPNASFLTVGILLSLGRCLLMCDTAAFLENSRNPVNLYCIVIEFLVYRILKTVDSNLSISEE